MVKKGDSQTGELYKKEIPKMPEGYYSGDKPNSNLRAFVERHITQGKSDLLNSSYVVSPFKSPIMDFKSGPIYNMHSYWSKKPYGAVAQYIKHYTKTGDLILDPFCGSGGTILQALTAGRKAIGIDILPFCTFITRNYVKLIDFDQVEKISNRICDEIEREFKWVFQIPINDGAIIIADGFYHADYVRCNRCFKKESFYYYRPAGKFKYECPHCSEIHNTRSRNINWEGSDVCVLLVRNGRILKKIEVKNHPEIITAYQDICIKCESLLKDHYSLSPPIPQPLIDLGGRLATTGTLKVADLFSLRTHVLINAYLSKAQKFADNEETFDSLKFILSSALINLTLMYYVHEGGGGHPGAGGIYYMPPIRREMSVLDVLRHKTQDLKKGFQEKNRTMNELSTQVIISTEDAENALRGLPSNSIDYIFTDPPYADTMPYVALNCIWNYWFGWSMSYSEEILGINWLIKMKPICIELYRVLKPGRCVSICYHDTSEGTWADLQDAFLEAGFVPEVFEKVLSISSEKRSYQQYVSGKVTKKDLVINFRKPVPGEIVPAIVINGNEDAKTFNEKVKLIIREYLETHEGVTKDLIYDEVVSRMVRIGQMEVHDFGELLRQVAEDAKVEGERNQGERWYLKESVLAEADDAETAREDAAAGHIGAFIKEHLKKHPSDEGIHYSDLFENYISAVKDKPRRQLAEILPDYFCKTEQGTWRLPDSEAEDRAKHEARVKGLGRRVKRYIAQLKQGVAIPDHEQPNDATIAEWLRHCKRSGLYEQGKLLYEKGGINLDNLTEEALVNVEEDYQVCVRMLARDSGMATASKPKLGRSIKP